MTCEAAGVLKTVCKPAAAALPIEIDLYEYCALFWRANEDYDADEYVVPRASFGYALQAQAAGRSGAREPRWKGSLGETIRDGSITWTIVAASAGGLNAASSPTSSVSPSGELAVADIAISESRKLTLTYTGGTAGTDYEVTLGFVVDGLQQYITQTVTVT